MPTMGDLRCKAARRTVESSVTVVEDAPIGRHQPVALAVSCGGDADDRLGQVQLRRRPIVDSVAVIEDLPVRGDQPVTLAVSGRRRCRRSAWPGGAWTSDRRRRRRRRGRRPRSKRPASNPGHWHCGHRDDRRRELLARHAAVVRGRPRTQDLPGAGREPVRACRAGHAGGRPGGVDKGKGRLAGQAGNGGRDDVAARFLVRRKVGGGGDARRVGQDHSSRPVTSKYAAGAAAWSAERDARADDVIAVGVGHSHGEGYRECGAQLGVLGRTRPDGKGGRCRSNV